VNPETSIVTQYGNEVAPRALSPLASSLSSSSHTRDHTCSRLISTATSNYPVRVAARSISTRTMFLVTVDEMPRAFSSAAVTLLV